MSQLAQFRSLAIIYGIAVLVGIAEFVLMREAPPDPNGIFVDPVHNYPETMSKLYPGRAENLYFEGRQVESSVPTPKTVDELHRYQQAQRAAAEYYERGLAAGLRSDENLIYNYAVALMWAQADPAKIEAAIATWHRNFPASEREDLAELYKEIQLAYLRIEYGS